ncbi:hypothetical protein [Tenacibaculum maritimum]|uniref:hypothetical protein n=1 Tax=Tenacibaculum maritimum TaxID=107401 RepID=UPI0004068DBE|nr:hypothetical protein [Tenacibaculum maritimum]MDB0599813.1 hypothetical protein [Tenacibaculum maritimum]MDB0610923.1 hypothetical protein [Tenacibaculum maritimum]CAA0248105.1 hypothetical protein TMP248_60135 [Tenacibaculum maritimum]CAA0260023.1 hypothetical protein TMFC_90012 [Tenacibaculum maritimum]
MSDKLFKVGEPIPSIWLHMEFDFNDTAQYLGGVLVPNQKEATRLEKKYNS